MWWGVGVVGLFIARGDEIFVAPCASLNKSQAMEFDLGVDDQGMIRY